MRSMYPEEMPNYEASLFVTVHVFIESPKYEFTCTSGQLFYITQYKCQNIKIESFLELKRS